MRSFVEYDNTFERNKLPFFCICATIDWIDICGVMRRDKIHGRAEVRYTGKVDT